MIPYFKFNESAPDSIKATGHLLDFLKRQQKGLSGHSEMQGFPFNSAMWNGGIDRIIKESVIYGDAATETPRQEQWWPYEQSAYLIDGLLRLAILLDDKKLFRKAADNLDYVLAHTDADGKLGRCYGEMESEWPLAVMLRALNCYSLYKKSSHTDNIVLKHFEALSISDLAEGFRHINNIETMLQTACRHNRQDLIKKAEEAYLQHDKRCIADRHEELELNWSKLTENNEFSIHGVSFSESVKLPAILFGATGKKHYLEKAEAALERIIARHEQLPGIISSNEYLSGNDPLQGYETCVITDFTWALGFFLMASGDGKYADRIEKIIYNALPGSVLKDFSALAYFTSPNQTVAAPWSSHNYYYRGGACFNQYRPDHSAQCCPGNVHRAMPNFAMRLFMLDNNENPVAALYAPGIFTHRKCIIETKTNYPFEDNICFDIDVINNEEIDFTFRIPAWCDNPQIKLNGKEITSLPIQKGFAVLKGLTGKNRLELYLPSQAKIKSRNNYMWVERGTLLFALPVKQKIKKEFAGRFSPRIITPAEKWNYTINKNSSITVKQKKNTANSYFWEDPPLQLKLKGCQITNFDSLANGRYTPDIPLYSERYGKSKDLILIPYGCTELRISAFPDAVKRTPCHIYQALGGKAFKYGDIEPAENLLPIDILQLQAKELEVAKDGAYNLLQNYGDIEDGVVPVFLRFRAEHDGEAIFAVSASTCGDCFVNGQKTFHIPYPFNAEYMMPLWFKAHVSRGYNTLTIKVRRGYKYFQYRNDWRVKADIFQ